SPALLCAAGLRHLEPARSGVVLPRRGGILQRLESRDDLVAQRAKPGRGAGFPAFELLWHDRFPPFGSPPSASQLRARAARTPPELRHFGAGVWQRRAAR